MKLSEEIKSKISRLYLTSSDDSQEVRDFITGFNNVIDLAIRRSSNFGSLLRYLSTVDLYTDYSIRNFKPGNISLQHWHGYREAKLSILRLVKDLDPKILVIG